MSPKNDIINEAISLYKSTFGPKDLKKCTRYAVEKFIAPETIAKLGPALGFCKNDYIDYMYILVETELNRREENEKRKSN